MQEPPPLRALTLRGEGVPLLCGASLHGLGVEAVGDLLSAGAESSGTGASALVA